MGIFSNEITPEKNDTRPAPELYFHTMEQTAQRLTNEGLTDWKEVQTLLPNV